MRRAIAELFKGRWHRLVNDLKVTTTRKLLELHQRKVRLDPRRVTIHDQTNGACRGNDGNLGVTETVLFAQLQRLVPCGHGNLGQAHIRAVRVVQWHWLDVQTFIAVFHAKGCVAVVTNNAQHMRLILLVARKGPQLTGHLGRGRIGHTRHDRGQSSTHSTALVTVVTKAHVHQQTADVGIAQTKCAEVIRPLRNRL